MELKIKISETKLLKTKIKILERKLSNYNSFRFLLRLQNANSINKVEKIFHIENENNYFLLLDDSEFMIVIDKKTLDEKLKEVEVIK